MCVRHEHLINRSFFAETPLFETSSAVIAATLCSIRLRFIDQSWKHLQGILFFCIPCIEFYLLNHIHRIKGNSFHIRVFVEENNDFIEPPPSET